MKIQFENVVDVLICEPRMWLITGVAGFIGSNILEFLLLHNQRVVGLDNFETGHQSNIDQVKNSVTISQWGNFKLLRGDIRNIEDCRASVRGIDFVLHQAAIGSVPRSIENPMLTNDCNVNGFLNMLIAAKDARVQSFVYAASSSTYGDHPALPKEESVIGSPLSPYAVTKYINELYASVFAGCYGFNSVGLRYFNVFGRRQDPMGSYAAVIPKWIDSMIKGDDVYINGNGETSRDFCYVDNVVQANILAALFIKEKPGAEVFNIAVGERISLSELFQLIKESLGNLGLEYQKDAILRDFREGDVLHSQASIEKAKNILHYRPNYSVRQGMEKTVKWYTQKTAAVLNR